MFRKYYLSKKSCIAVGLLIFLGIALFLNSKMKNNWKYATKTTMAFVKRQIQSNPVNIKNYPSIVEQFLTHLRVLYNLNNETKKNIPSPQKIAGFNLSFPDYMTLHVLYNEIFICKEYLFYNNKKSPFIIDCGSNIGMTTLFFKLLYPEAKILAFEPSKINFKLFEKNINNNNLKNIQLIKKALSNKVEKIKLYNPGSMICSTNNKGSDRFEMVETTLLSDYINKEVDFLKMDIEGAETLVFDDLKNKNKLKFINEMIIEYHHTSNKNGLSNILKSLEDNNFAYQISSNVKTPFEKNKFQAFLIHAYKR